MLFLSGCTYGPVQTVLTIENTDIKPGTRTFVVAVRYIKLRQPTGINTLPDGGISMVLEQAALFYVCDADKKSARLLAKLNVPQYLWIGFAPSVMGWEGEHFYFQLTGCAHTPCAGNIGYKNEYYEMSLNGEFRKVNQIPAGVHLRSTSLAAMPNEQNYLRVSADNYSIDICTANSGKFKREFVIDQSRQALIPAK